MLNKNAYFQTLPLVAQGFIVAPCPYSGVVSATKRALENKGFFDIQYSKFNWYDQSSLDVTSPARRSVSLRRV